MDVKCFFLSSSHTLLWIFCGFSLFPSRCLEVEQYRCKGGIYDFPWQKPIILVAMRPELECIILHPLCVLCSIILLFAGLAALQDGAIEFLLLSKVLPSSATFIHALEVQQIVVAYIFLFCLDNAGSLFPFSVRCICVVEVLVLMLHHQFIKVFLSSGMDVDMESLGSSQYPSPDQYMMSEEADQGWVSWAWSFVPAIVGAEDEGEEGVYQQHDTGSIPSSQLTAKDPIVSIGFYCTKASVTFKV